jgi:hypothetical protein
MSDELATVSPESLIANKADELSGFNTEILQWAVQKLNDARKEYEDLDTARAEAKKNKWNTKALSKAASLALSRVNFYEKVHKAVESGYMLFPPVPNADVIAIRTNHVGADLKTLNTRGWASSPRILEERSEAPGIGKGSYKSPYVGWTMIEKFNNEKGEECRTWETVSELKDAEFPLIMAKPKIVKAVNAAMELKVFDEIRMFPFVKRRGDPCILGVVYNPKDYKRNYFLISWLINKGDL